MSRKRAILPTNEQAILVAQAFPLGCTVRYYRDVVTVIAHSLRHVRIEHADGRRQTVDPKHLAKV